MSGFLKTTAKAASKLTFKDFFILGALSAILTKTTREKRKKKKERAKIKLKGISISANTKTRKSSRQRVSTR